MHRDNAEAEVEEIKALMKKYKRNQLHLPLHAAVMISPLYLLAPIQLHTLKWDRPSMLLVRVAIS